MQQFVATRLDCKNTHQTEQARAATHLSQTVGDMCSEMPQPLPQSCKLSRLLAVFAHVFLHSLNDIEKGHAFHQPACRSSDTLSVLPVQSWPLKPEMHWSAPSACQAHTIEQLRQRNTSSKYTPHDSRLLTLFKLSITRQNTVLLWTNFSAVAAAAAPFGTDIAAAGDSLNDEVDTLAHASSSCFYFLALKGAVQLGCKWLACQ